MILALMKDGVAPPALLADTCYGGTENQYRRSGAHRSPVKSSIWTPAFGRGDELFSASLTPDA